MAIITTSAHNYGLLSVWNVYYYYYSPVCDNEVHDVEGCQYNHHEQHAVDGKVPYEVPAQKTLGLLLHHYYSFLVPLLLLALISPEHENY